MCVCVCVCMYAYMHTYIHTYICVCVSHILYGGKNSRDKVGFPETFS